MISTNDTDKMLEERKGEIPRGIATVITQELGNFVTRMQKDFDLSPPDSTALKNEIALTLLAFEPVTELALNIKNHTSVSNKIADNIADKVLNNLIGAEFSELIEINNYQNSTESEKPPELTESKLVKSTIEEEEELDAGPTVQPLRTMEHDMDKIHGYGSYRKIYPEPKSESKESEVTPPMPKIPKAHGAIEEKVTKAISQEETLRKNNDPATPPVVDNE